MSEIVIFVSSTGNFNIITLDHMNKLKNIAFVGNTGHFDNEINFAALTVDDKTAKLHISRSVHCGAEARQRRTKIHAESSSNGCARPSSDISGE